MKGLLVCQYFPRRIIATMQAGSNLKELCWIPCTFKNSKVKLNQNYFSISRVYALWAYVAVIVFRPWPTVSRLTWWERQWYFSQASIALLWCLLVTAAQRSNGTKPNQTTSVCFAESYFDPDPLCPAWHGGRDDDIFHSSFPGIISIYQLSYGTCE